MPGPFSTAFLTVSMHNASRRHYHQVVDYDGYDFGLGPTNWPLKAITALIDLGLRGYRIIDPTKLDKAAALNGEGLIQFTLHRDHSQRTKFTYALLTVLDDKITHCYDGHDIGIKTGNHPNAHSPATAHNHLGREGYDIYLILKGVLSEKGDAHYTTYLFEKVIER